MAIFLTTPDIVSGFSKLLREAKQKIVIISPYLQISNELYQRLKDAESRGVQITFVFGKDRLSSDEEDKLSSLKEIKVYYLENLHAKCYFNESKAIITSMNFYEYSQANREMGILVRAIEEANVYQEVIDEANSIINHAEPVKIKSSNYYENTNYHSNNSGQVNIRNGFCIRCHAEIEFDGSGYYTMCSRCFDTWSAFGDPYYQERFCHMCGNTSPTSKAQPICNSCYRSG